MRDEASYVTFVTDRWAGLYRLAWLLTGSDAAAEDLTQTALEKAYVAWSRISRLDAPEAYVRRILVNAAISARRRRRIVDEQPTAVLPEAVGEAAHDSALDRSDLWPHIVALPPRQRAVLVLRYYEDLSEAEIAEVLGCARGTVKSQAYDALRALRTRLTELPGGVS